MFALITSDFRCIVSRFTYTMYWIARIVLVLGVCEVYSLTDDQSIYVAPLPNTEGRLAKHLVDTSRSGRLDLTRPVSNQGEPLRVKFGVAVTQVDMDEDLELLRATLWLRHVRYCVLFQFCVNKLHVLGLLLLLPLLLLSPPAPPRPPHSSLPPPPPTTTKWHTVK